MLHSVLLLIKHKTTTFSHNSQAVIGIAFALLLVPIVLFSAMAVDLSRLYILRLRMRSVIEGAALAGASHYKTQALANGAKEIAMLFLNKELFSSGLNDLIPEVNVITKEIGQRRIVEVTAKHNPKLYLTGLLSYLNFELNEHASAAIDVAKETMYYSFKFIKLPDAKKSFPAWYYHLYLLVAEEDTGYSVNPLEFTHVLILTANSKNMVIDPNLLENHFDNVTSKTMLATELVTGRSVVAYKGYRTYCRALDPLSFIASTVTQCDYEVRRRGLGPRTIVTSYWPNTEYLSHNNFVTDPDVIKKPKNIHLYVENNFYSGAVVSPTFSSETYYDPFAKRSSVENHADSGAAVSTTHSSETYYDPSLKNNVRNKWQITSPTEGYLKCNTDASNPEVKTFYLNSGFFVSNEDALKALQNNTYFDLIYTISCYRTSTSNQAAHLIE